MIGASIWTAISVAAIVWALVWIGFMVALAVSLILDGIGKVRARLGRNKLADERMKHLLNVHDRRFKR